MIFCSRNTEITQPILDSGRDWNTGKWKPGLHTDAPTSLTPPLCSHSTAAFCAGGLAGRSWRSLHPLVYPSSTVDPNRIKPINDPFVFFSLLLPQKEMHYSLITFLLLLCFINSVDQVSCCCTDCDSGSFGGSDVKLLHCQQILTGLKTASG